MAALHLLLPSDPDCRITLAHDGRVSPPKGRELPNTTILAMDQTRPELIWKLTPWEKAETVSAELEIYAQLLRTAAPGIIAEVMARGAPDAASVIVLRL